MLAPKIRRFLFQSTDPSVRYLALRDLCDRPDGDSQLKTAQAEIGRKGWAWEILSLQEPSGKWATYREEPTNLYLPKYTSTNFLLLVLSELGMTRKDRRIARAASLLLDRWSNPKEGVWGEAGAETCITGNGVRMMVRFGFLEDPRIQRAIDWLVSAQKSDGGWHCWRSRTGTLAAWEAMAAFAAIPPESRSAPVVRAIER